MQMEMEPLRWNEYSNLTGQMFNNSVLSDDNVQYNTMPVYLLPQMSYRPPKRKAFAQYMWPILFRDKESGSLGIQLETLLQDLAVLTPTIADGTERVFRGRAYMANINLRIMVCSEHLLIPLRLCLRELQWPGYNPGYGTQQPIQISVDTNRITRAMIAQIIAQKVVQFMKVSATYSADWEQLFIS